MATAPSKTDLFMPDARRRVGRSAAAARALAAEIDAWLVARRAEQAMRRFANHLTVLEVALRRVLERVDNELAALPVDGASGPTYERCRELDLGLATVRRVFDWYAAKYDQRFDPRYRAVLLSADEVARSCWSEAFEALRIAPPTGPLCYVDNRPDALATRRDAAPTELRRTATDLAADLIRRLPIPTIALPEVATRESWWLVLAAHETGHHVHRDLAPGIDGDVKNALAAVHEQWPDWSLEVFADAFSVVMVGDSAECPIGELVYGPTPRLVRMPAAGSAYPPPLVRLALLAELAHRPGAAMAARWLDDADVPSPVRETIAEHLAVAPAVATAMLDLAIGGVPLREFATGGERPGWSHQLTTPNPLIAPRNTRAAARLVIAAGVRACREAAPDQLERLHGNLLDVLPTCGAPGLLAPPRPAAHQEAAAAADRVADRILRGDGR